jgi:hypothetical protein
LNVLAGVTKPTFFRRRINYFSRGNKMNKSLFGLITAAALVAIGVLVYNRSVEDAARAGALKAKNDIKPAAAAISGGCCSADATTGGQATCCADEAGVSTACLKNQHVAVAACCGDSEACSASATAAASAEKSDCCAEGKAKCCAASAASEVAKKNCCAQGACCAECLAAKKSASDSAASSEVTAEKQADGSNQKQ